LKDLDHKGGSLFNIDVKFPGQTFPFEAYRWLTE
jgi:hypothetical protein